MHYRRQESTASSNTPTKNIHITELRRRRRRLLKVYARIVLKPAQPSRLGCRGVVADSEIRRGLRELVGVAFDKPRNLYIQSDRAIGFQ
jgi:hypothetical protein